MFGTPRFILPSLGLPAFLSPSSHSFSTFITLSGPLDAGARFSLIPLNHAHHECIFLDIVSIKQVSRMPIDTPLNRELEIEETGTIYHIELALPAPVIPREAFRYVLFNLTHPQIATSYHSVVYTLHEWETCRFIFATDIHVATKWEEVESAISHLGEEHRDKEDITGILFSSEAYQGSFVNPNRNLTEFIRKCNSRAEAGDLDLIIIGGDLVDYKYKSPRNSLEESYQGTNFSLFEDLITGKYHNHYALRVPIVTTTGNHDYRLFPYLLRTYGLKHCGLHRYQTDFLLAEALPHESHRVGLADIDSVRIKEMNPKHTSLHYYSLHINPMKDFSLVLGRTKFIFLDTGPDVIMNLRSIRPRRYPNLVRSLFFGVSDPDSEAFPEEQIEFLRREIESFGSNNIVLVFHASLFNPKSAASYGAENEVGHSETLRSFINFRRYLEESDYLGFEAMIKTKQLSVGCAFQNHLALLDEVSRRDKNFLGLSGHLHRRARFVVDKNAKEVLYSRSVAEISKSSLAGRSYLLTAASLGHPQTKDSSLYYPEFYTITIGPEMIESISVDALAAAPLNRFHFSISASEVAENRLDFIVNIGVEGPDDEIQAIVHLLVVSKRKLEPTEIILESQEKGELNGRTVAPSCLSRFLPRAKGAIHYCVDASLDQPTRFRLSALKHRASLEVVGIAQFKHTDCTENLRICWHPHSLYLHGIRK